MCPYQLHYNKRKTKQFITTKLKSIKHLSLITVSSFSTYTKKLQLYIHYICRTRSAKTALLICKYDLVKPPNHSYSVKAPPSHQNLTKHYPFTASGEISVRPTVHRSRVEINASSGRKIDPRLTRLRLQSSAILKGSSHFAVQRRRPSCLGRGLDNAPNTIGPVLLGRKFIHRRNSGGARNLRVKYGGA